MLDLELEEGRVIIPQRGIGFGGEVKKRAMTEEKS